MKLRYVLLPILGLLVLLAGADLLLWHWAEQQLGHGWTTWAASARVQGWTVDGGTPVAGGWPLTALLEVPELTLSGAQADLPGGLTWSADRIVLEISLLHPRRLAISAEGAQRLRLGEAPEIPYTADRLRAVLPLDPRVPPRAVVARAVNLRAGMPAGALPAGALTAASLDLRAEWTPAAQQNEPVVAYTVTVAGIGLPSRAGLAWPLGQRVDQLVVEGAMDGPLPGVPGLTPRATAWRNGGGTLDIRRLRLRWGPLDLAATATLALDESLQPMGTGTARIGGLDPTLDALAAGHVMTERGALAAKAVLALMAHASDEDGRSAVEVPLTLQDRRLALGRIPLARVPELVWP